jgi:hypothetical protein
MWALPSIFATRGEGRLRTLVAPAAAGILLTLTTWLVCERLDLFTGAGPAVNWTLAALTPVLFLTGVFVALRTRRTRPDVYAKLATTDID